MKHFVHFHNQCLDITFSSQLLASCQLPSHIRTLNNPYTWLAFFSPVSPSIPHLPMLSAIKSKLGMVHMPPQVTGVCDISAGCVKLLLGAY